MSLILTQAGLLALARAETTGEKLQGTHMAVGDGNGTTPEHIGASTALINEKWRGPLQSITLNEQGETDAGQQVVFECHVPITVGGWYIREVGLYADDVLLAVGPHPTLYKPAPEDPTKMEHVIKAPVAFSNADNVKLIVDPAVVLASQEFVNNAISDHNTDENAHADLLAGFVRISHTALNPPGTIITCASQDPPAGYLDCNGAWLSKTAYKSLFTAIGTRWGNDEAGGRFRLPDLRGRFLRGYSTGQSTGVYQNDALPGITGTLAVRNILSNNTGVIQTGTPSGAFYNTGTGHTLGKVQDIGGNSSNSNQIAFSASRSSSIYGAAAEVRPANMAVLYAIKY